MAEQIAYNMDCMEYMKTLPDKAFDLAVVDPPYGDGVAASADEKKNSTAELDSGKADRSRSTDVRSTRSGGTWFVKYQKPVSRILSSQKKQLSIQKILGGG